jgi:hypothetical protein
MWVIYIALLMTAGIFVAIRFAALQTIARPGIANASGLLGALVFLFGMRVGAALFGAAPPAPLAPASPVAAVAPAPPVAAPSPTRAPVDYSALPIRAIPASGTPIIAAIDSVNTDQPAPPAATQFAFVRGSTIVLGGWAASAAKTHLRRLIFVIDHRQYYDATARYGLARPDVAKAYNDGTMLRTGYNSVWLRTAGLVNGPHVLQVGGVSAESGHFQLAPLKVEFTIE